MSATAASKISELGAQKFYSSMYSKQFPNSYHWPFCERHKSEKAEVTLKESTENDDDFKTALFRFHILLLLFERRYRTNNKFDTIDRPYCSFSPNFLYSCTVVCYSFK